jgi:hypothetical protein
MPMMKYFSLLMLLICLGGMAAPQENKDTGDTTLHYQGITSEECPPEFLKYINPDSLRSKAVLLVLNEALHPLGRYEFYDNGRLVRSMRISMRMNRCTMLYIDSGQHAYHTVYQQLKVPLKYEVGKIYLAHLISRKVWPLGGISVIKINEQGEQVEYAAVLFEYISPATAMELYQRMNKREILVNE